MSSQNSKTERFNLDKQLSTLYDGKILTENEIKLLCDKVTI
jgi:hypothetical protein